MNYFKFSVLLLLFTLPMMVRAKDRQLSSPDGKIRINVAVGDRLSWSVAYGNEQLLKPSPIAMRLNQPTQPGIQPILIKSSTRTHRGTITAAIPVKSKFIEDHFNEMRMDFKGGYSVLFRAYNDGVAYRFETAMSTQEMEVQSEQADFNFSSNYKVFWPEEKDPEFQSHYESLYKDSLIAAFPSNAHAALPMLLITDAGTKMLISEADLYDYPNLFLFGTKANGLTAGFPKVILDMVPVRDRTNKITKLASYQARTKGSRTFPWRSIAICKEDKALLENNLTYKLSSTSVLPNTDWIKPGKVAWDWWNDNNIYGVNFKAGINTATYKYFIDFAAKYGLEYIMLDEGWTKSTTDLMHTHADIDIQEIINYGKSKKVGIWLWTLWDPLDRDMEKILALYQQWGAVGIKVDFMARADQYMVNFYERVAATAAKHHLMVDLHGAYKPVGLNRKYPNVLSYEGVRGLENCKWSADITPKHDVTLPFIRMAAGPMDYTPGAMLNASVKNFKIDFSSPMSMGTRAHQVAMYVMYDSPLQMLADNPSNYQKDSVCTRFISRIPTTWDQTIALDGKVGAYAVIARKHGGQWYLSAMGDNQKRDFEVQLNFLDGKRYAIEILSDGINADRHAADYQMGRMEGDQKTKLNIKLEQGGGYCAILSPLP